MIKTSATAQSSICNDEEDTHINLKDFCFNHLSDHRETINKEFNQTEGNLNLFRQILNHQENRTM